MTQGRRVKLSAAQRADLWSRWRAGESLQEIGRALGKDHVVIHFLLARHGGIAPPARRRSLRTLTLAEREDISRGIASGGSIRDIRFSGTGPWKRRLARIRYSRWGQ
jgi:transposase, IS30 family